MMPATAHTQKNRLINKAFRATLYVLGGNEKNWHIKHNRLHHTFTNVHNMDPDISRVSLLRLTPEAPHKPIHKKQHYYAWILYCLVTIDWTLTFDLQLLNTFKKSGLIHEKKYAPLIIETIALKLFYYFYLFVIPYYVIGGISFLFWLACFMTLHIVAGLSAIFQVAHVMPQCNYPTANDEGTIDNNWAAHQLQTTSNFSESNTLLTWLIGGLNFQIEHHLFPRICHVHYRNISHIVKKKAQEYGLPYHSQKSFFNALK